MWAKTPDGLRDRVIGELEESSREVEQTDAALAQALGAAAHVLDLISAQGAEVSERLQADVAWLLERVE